MKKVILLFAFSVFFFAGCKARQPDPYRNGIKILAIGNSYTENSMLYLSDMLRQLGVTGNITLVNAFISGGTLKDHAEHARANQSTKLQRRTFLAGGGQTSATGITLLQMIQQEAWDVITLQQASMESGASSTYNADLDYLIDYVRKNATNKNFKLGWHMTWAWADGISYYNGTYGNQDKMYQAICTAVQTKIVPELKTGVFDFIIPTGTAIQNYRVHGDHLNHDGTHLSNLGCYIAATMWVKTITGYDISKLTTPYVANKTWGGAPSVTINATDLPDIIQAVNAAAKSPFAVTPP